MAEFENVFDVHGYLKDQYGATLKDRNDDGTWQVTRDGEDGKLDLKSLLATDFQEMGKNLGKTQLNFSTPENPLEDNALGFGNQMKFAVAQTPKDKIRLLREEYGQGNVRFNAKDKRFIVREADGQWRPAESKFLTDLLANEGGAIAGSIAGTKLGAAAGSIIPGAGTLTGAVLGGAIGGVVGKMATIADAHTLGIRSELDAEDVIKQLGTEFAIGLAGGTLVPVGKKAIVSFGKSIGDIGRKATSAGTIDAMARLLTNTTGTKNVDNMRRALKNPDKITRWMDDIDDWNKAKIQADGAGRVQKKVFRDGKFVDLPGAKRPVGPNPIIDNMGKIMNNLVIKSKNFMNRNFEGFFADRFNRNAIARATVDPGNTRIQFANFLRDHNFLDEAGRIVTENPGNRRALRSLERVMNRFGFSGSLEEIATAPVRPVTKANAMRFNDAWLMRKEFDAILEAGGEFSGGAFKITTEAKGFIRKLRRQLSNDMEAGLKKVSERTANNWKKVNTDFAAARDIFDDIGRSKVFDPGNVEGRFNQIFNENGIGLATTLQKLTGNGKVPGSLNTIELLRDMNAAVNLSSMFKTGTSSIIPQVSGLGLGGLTGGFTFGPFGAIAGAGLGFAVSSPRFAPRIAAATINKLQKLGRASNWIYDLTPSQRDALIKNLPAINGLTQAVTSAIGTEERLTNAFTEQGLSTNGVR